VDLARNPARSNLFLGLLVVHMAASLWHHIHNGQFMDEYPNMPAGVPHPLALAVMVWGITSAIGLAGYYWVCNGRRALGFGAMGLYAARGLLAFSHYKLAPMAAHTFVQNSTILGEGLTGLLLLITLLVFVARDRDI
jgi:hypothetical protein